MIDNEDPQTPPLEPELVGYTGYLLRSAFSKTQGYGLAAMPQGRTPRELGVLMTLIANGPLSQTRLSELLHINRSNMVNVVDGLEEAGYVQRDRDPADRRRYALRVTPEGVAACGALKKAADDASARAFAVLSSDQRTQLNMLLVRLMPDQLHALPASLTGRTGFLLARAHHRASEIAGRRLNELGLASRHFGVLYTLEAAAHCSQQRLADRLGVTGAAIVQSLDDLESQGLIRRERNLLDRREHILHLTESGRERLNQAKALMAEIQRSWTERLGEQDLDCLNRLLAKLAKESEPYSPNKEVRT